MSTGRSARRSAPIATSIPTSATTAPDQARFAAAFAREIAHMAAMQPGRTVTSIFFGGGTPSLMQPATVETILTAIHDAWTVPDGIEITMEGNPSSADAGRFAGYRAAGVNRLSLGVQSLDDAQLKFLGRLHDAAEARTAIDLARKTFPRLSFDMIYARPHQIHRSVARGIERGHRPRCRPPVALPADHRAGYAVLRPPPPWADSRAGRRPRRRSL